MGPPMSRDLPHLEPWGLLPAAPDKCQECAVQHEPSQPHNQQSLFYQYRFYGQHGRWPTWADAMAHCEPDVRRQWIEELAKHGIVVAQ